MAGPPCPSCGHPLESASDPNCPACGASVPVVSLGPVRVSLALDEDGEAPIRGLPPPPKPFRPVLTSVSTAPEVAPLLDRCAHCHARLPPRSVACPACHEPVAGALVTGQSPQELRRDREPHRGPMLRALGIFSLLLALFAPAITLPLTSGFFPVVIFGSLLSVGLSTWTISQAVRDIGLIDRGLMDWEGRSATGLALGLSIAGLVIGSLVLFLSVGHAVLSMLLF